MCSYVQQEVNVWQETPGIFSTHQKHGEKFNNHEKTLLCVLSLAMMNESFPKTVVFESFWHQWRSLPKTIGVLFFASTTPKPFLLISPATIHALPATLRGPTMGVATGAVTNAMKDVVSRATGLEVDLWLKTFWNIQSNLKLYPPWN